MNNDFSIITKAKRSYQDALNKGVLLKEEQFLNHEMTSATKSLLQKWYQGITKLSFLSSLPENLEEVFIFPQAFIQIKTRYGKENYLHDFTWEDIKLSFETLCIQNRIDWNYNRPFVSFFTKIQNKEYRASFVHQKISGLQEPQFFLRRNKQKAFPLCHFTTKQSFFAKLLKDKENIVIAGATGSGKTSFINALLTKINPHEHIITLEDTFELSVKSKNTTRLLSSSDTNESLDKLLSYSLRMSPDRIILGELRSTEITSFIQALNTGHKGLLTSIHANNAQDTLSRLALLFQLHSGINMTYELALKLVTNNINYVVFMQNKKITEIIKVYGSEGATSFYDTIDLEVA